MASEVTAAGAAVQDSDGDGDAERLSGHRARLRAQFRRSEGAALSDLDLLEALLFAIPRRDVRPLARTLLHRFGSFAGAISAPRPALRAIPGIGDTAIDALKLVREAALRLAREEILGRPLMSSWDKVLAYARAELAHGDTERFFVMFLDRKNALIAAEERGRGTVDHAPVYPREVVKRALELNASALILVHNHPSGDPTPSDADISMTHQVQDAAQVLGLVLHDHLIIGKSREISFRAAGYL
jgi:DNA repair protein RadC